MKNCELCKSPAQTFCESDQATLCWECDAKVHGANFLVARHSRSLLCNDCKSPTPWKASGTRLGHTVSVCDGCAAGGSQRGDEESGGANEDDPDTEAEEDEEDDADEYDEYEEDQDQDQDADGDDDGENQVVPWSSTPPPPAASSSSSDDDFSGTFSMFSRKRMRGNSPDLSSLDDRFCSSSQQTNSSKLTAADGEREEEATFADSLRSLKSRKGELERRRQLERNGSTSTVILR